METDFDNEIRKAFGVAHDPDEDEDDDCDDEDDGWE